MNKPRLFGLLVLGAMCASPCLALQSSSTSPDQRERLTYCSYRPAGWDLYLHEEAGAEPRRLTDHPALDYNAVFAPDGRWVVFTSERSGDPSLFVLDLEQGGEPRLLIRGAGMQDQAAIAPDQSSIVFVSTHSGNAELYLLPFSPEETQDLEGALNLTNNPGGDFRPTFSPDGNRIAFCSDRDGPSYRHPGIPFAIQEQGDVYVMNADGGELERVTNTAGWDGSPAWSRDGESLLFYSERGGEAPYQLYSVVLATGEVDAVTPAQMPALSPVQRTDGTVLFTTWEERGRARGWRIMSIDPSGNLRQESASELDALNPEVHPKTGALLYHGAPPFSEEGSIASFPGPFLVDAVSRELELPDRRVDFIAHRQAFTAPPHPHRSEVAFRQGSRGLSLADSTGEGRSSLLDLDDRPESFDGAISHLRFSRGGEWISFTIGPFGGPPDAQADAWRIRVDGSELTNLTPGTPGNDGLAEFSQDGSRFVFRSGRTGNFDIFLAEADGGQPRNLTDHPASDTFPALSPDGKQVAFSSDRNGQLDAATGLRNFDLYTLEISADGSPGELARITNNDSQNAHVGYSPDGAWLIYASGKSGLNDEGPLVQEVVFNPQLYGEIYAYKLDDGTSLRLTHNKWEDGAPVWEQPASAPARPPVADALASLIESEGAESAFEMYRELESADAGAYRFGEGGLVALAERFLQAGNPGLAAETYRVLTLVQPTGTRAHLELAKFYQATDQLDAAVAEYRLVLQADADNLEAQWSLMNAGAEGYARLELSPEQLDTLVGTYFPTGESESIEFVVSRDDQQLSISVPGAPGPLPLIAISETCFFVTMEPVRVNFSIDAEGVAGGIDVKYPGGGEQLQRRE